MKNFITRTIKILSISFLILCIIPQSPIRMLIDEFLDERSLAELNTLLCVSVIVLIVTICLAIHYVKTNAKKNLQSKHLRKIKLDNESLRPALNQMCDLLESYREIKSGELDAVINAIPEDCIADKHDSEIFEAINTTILCRKVMPTFSKENTDISLKQNEKLIAKEFSVSLWRYVTDSTSISGSGFRMSNKGFRVFSGNVSTRKNEILNMIEGIGKMYITNQRIIYITPQGKSYVVPMSRILDYAVDDDSVVLIVSNGKPYKFQSNNNLWYYKDTNTIMDTTFNMARAISVVKNPEENEEQKAS